MDHVAVSQLPAVSCPGSYVALHRGDSCWFRGEESLWCVGDPKAGGGGIQTSRPTILAIRRRGTELGATEQ